MLRYRTYCLDGRVKVALLPMRAEELKGHLDALLLAALKGGPRHGYAVIEALRQDSGGRLDLPTGTIHPVLRRAGGLAGVRLHRPRGSGGRAMPGLSLSA